MFLTVVLVILLTTEETTHSLLLVGIAWLQFYTRVFIQISLFLFVCTQSYGLNAKLMNNTASVTADLRPSQASTQLLLTPPNRS